MARALEATHVDTFDTGFAAETPGDPWFHVRMGAFVSADGAATPQPGGGLHIVAAGRHPLTGRPAFRNSLAPESVNGGIPATNDHAKWLAYMNRRSSAGFPGFDAKRGAQLVGTARLTGRTHGTEHHPFGRAVREPDTDPRLAAFAMVTLDVETWMVFDFLFTNACVFALYERLPFGRTSHNHYAAFSYAIPVATRAADDVHEASIAYETDNGMVRWMLDGREVYSITRLGRRLEPREHLLIDLGGTEQAVRPRQLDFGMGLFSVLDGAIADGQGLVRVSDALSYYSPPSGEPHALTFVDETSRLDSRLFGQGAEMSITSYSVRYDTVQS